MASFSTNAIASASYASSFTCFNKPSLPFPLSFNPLNLPLFWPWQKVKIGPMSVSPMGFGTWAWGNQLLWGYQKSMDAELQKTFNLAVENGINLFDTADSYGTATLNGRSEKLLGRFLRDFEDEKPLQNDIVIATKFAAYPWRLTPAQFVNACKASLDRLQIDQIGIGQLHWSTANYAPPQEAALWDGLVAMYDKGLVRAVGVSNYGPRQLLRIYDYLQARGVPLCSAQVQFSLLSMGEDQLEIKNICDSLGIRLIAYSPLGLGMLTGKYSPTKLPPGPRGFLFRKILPGLEPLLTSLKEISEQRRKTIPQVAINWCISKGTIPIPGVKTVEQAKENLGALGWRLSTRELLQLESGAMESPQRMIQNIFQTSLQLYSLTRSTVSTHNHEFMVSWMDLRQTVSDNNDALKISLLWDANWPSIGGFTLKKLVRLRGARVMVLAAINQPSELDEAVLCRLPQAFEIGAEMLKVISKDEGVENNVDFGIAGLCLLGCVCWVVEGRTGSDILELWKKAALFSNKDKEKKEKTQQ